MEQGGLLIRRVTVSDAFKGIPKHIIAAGNFVDGEIRLEQASIGTESFDTVFVIVFRCDRKFFTGRRLVVFVPAEAVHLHIDATELGDDILAFG